jgi:hypothetical protein
LHSDDVRRLARRDDQEVEEAGCSDRAWSERSDRQALVQCEHGVAARRDMNDVAGTSYIDRSLDLQVATRPDEVVRLSESARGEKNQRREEVRTGIARRIAADPRGVTPPKSPNSNAALGEGASARDHGDFPRLTGATACPYIWRAV